ncbi:MAG: GNAT family N-acetyltransferase [Saccharospirillum sp.]|nr:GNAT family N-acetyltransferase [Saccharospirillum sp.]
MTDENLIVRPAVPADLDDINAIIARAIQGWDLPERVKRLTLPSLQYSVTDFGFQSLWVAENDSIPVGMAAWQEASPIDRINTSPSLLLHGIYVNPDAQGYGVGRRLFAQSEEAARARGMAGIVVKAQKGSEAFYQAMGMTPMPVTDAVRQFENRLMKVLEVPSQ